MDRGVLTAELGVGGALLALPFTKPPSFSLNSLAPFLAFLKSTEVLRPTPPVAGRGGAGRGGVCSPSPLATGGAPVCKAGDGESSAFLVQFLLPESAGVEPPSELSLSSFRRLHGRLGVLGSPVIGRRVGGSRGGSPCRGGGAKAVGSSVGGGVDLRSSETGTEHVKLFC